jgi:protein phosphatase
MGDDTLMFETGAASHVGLVRSVNEDSHLLRPGIGIWVVSDGMGGHSAGRMASGMVVDGLTEVEPAAHVEALVADCLDHLRTSNARLREASHALGLGQAGATVVILALHSGKFTCIWCGDSRLYRVRNGEIAQLTTDHSEVEELVKSGALSRQEAKTWPRRNVITRAIGVSDEPRPETMEGALEANDVFVLCSDGLTNQLDDQEICAACVESDVQKAADRLIDETLARGATDNVTVIVVRCAQREPTVVDLSGTPRTRLAQAR